MQGRGAPTPPGWTEPGDAASATAAKTGRDLAPRAASLALDTAVVGFAVWTLIYHAALVMGGWAATTAAMSVAVVAVAAGLLGWHVRRLLRRPADRDREPATPLLVALTALAAAALSLIANRPDLDDVFYVNRSAFVEALGVLPLRDTMFGEEVFAMIDSQYPPVASFEALLGTVASMTGVPAASITYYVVPPLGSALAVLALWRLITNWELASPRIAFAVATTYLLFGGAFHASLGNTWIERMWQGKILFVSILVPILLVYLARWIRHGRRSDAVLGSAAAVAGVGLTSTAVFLLPAFFAVAALAALLLGQRSRAAALLIPVGYLILVGLTWLLLSPSGEGPTAAGGEQVPEPGPSTADLVTTVLGTGPYLIVGLAAAGLGWLAIRQRHARLLTLLLVATTALVVSPLGRAAMDLAGLPDAIRWRMLWLVPLPALLGALASGAGARLGRFGLGRFGPAAVGTALGLLVVLVGLPIWSPANQVTLGAPSWKWADGVRAEQTRVAAVALPGDLVGVAAPTGGMLTAVAGDVWSVNPRSNYTTSMKSEDGFCVDARFLVSQYSQGARAFDGEVAAALADLGVTVLVLPPGQPVPQVLTEPLGFVQTDQTRILRRDAAAAEPTPCRATRP